MSEVGDNSTTVDFELQVLWPFDTVSEPQVVNQAAFSWDQQYRDTIYIAFGHIGPPLWLTPEARDKGIAELGGKFIPVTPRGTFAMSRGRAEEIWEALGRHLGKLPPKPAADA